MALHTLKYLELNFPLLPDVGKIRNDTIICRIIHFGVFWGSEFN